MLMKTSRRKYNNRERVGEAFLHKTSFPDRGGKGLFKKH